MASNVQSTTLTGLSGVARRLVAEGALSESKAAEILQISVRTLDRRLAEGSG